MGDGPGPTATVVLAPGSDAQAAGQAFDPCPDDPTVRLATEWSQVTTEIAVLVRPGDVLLPGAVATLVAAFVDPSVVLACGRPAGGWTGPTSTSATGDLPLLDALDAAVVLAGPELAAQWVVALLEPGTIGPVAVRHSAARTRSPAEEPLLDWWLTILAQGSAATCNSGLLAAESVSNRPVRWLRPAEVAHWLDAIDRQVSIGCIDQVQELQATTALLRRAVLLPDLADLGPEGGYGLLVVECLADRLAALIAGTPVERPANPGYALVPVNLDAASLTASNWWHPRPTLSAPVTLQGPTVLLAGPETTQRQLHRFLPDDRSKDTER